MASALFGSARGFASKVQVRRYTFVEGILEKRAPYRVEHLEALNELTKKGDCLLGGAMAEPADSSMLLFRSRDAAEGFAKSDPYTKAGLVTKWSVRDYDAVAGSLLPTIFKLP